MLFHQRESISLMPNTLSPGRQTTSKANKQVNQEYYDDDQQHHKLDILPPHPPTQSPTPDSEIPRGAAQTISLVDEQINALTTLQHALDILGHDLPDAVHLALDIADGVVLAGLGGAVADH